MTENELHDLKIKSYEELVQKALSKIPKNGSVYGELLYFLYYDDNTSVSTNIEMNLWEHKFTESDNNCITFKSTEFSLSAELENFVISLARNFQRLNDERRFQIEEAKAQLYRKEQADSLTRFVSNF